MRRQLLLVEVEGSSNQSSVRDYLTPEDGFECRRDTWDPKEARALCSPGVALVLFGAPAQLEDPMQFFAWLGHHPIRVPSLAVLPKGSNNTVLQVASAMVDDFVISPVNQEELHCRIARIVGTEEEEGLLIRQQLNRELALAEFIGQDPEFVKAIANIPRIAASNAPVLLLGETGTGKELCARAIHNLSSRQNSPFIPVECGAIPENLVESELFGHVRGAFTDAHCNQKGLVAMAEGGTLFLDEIDSLPLSAQAKLLRFTQEGTYRPVGSQRFVKTNLRLIAATNNDLEKCIRESKFRSDLYFRLSVLPLRLPPLRERRQDIVLLADHFLTTISLSCGQPLKKLSPAALHSLQSHDWPGNVRELRNVVQRAVELSSCGGTILPIQLGFRAAEEPPSPCGKFRQARSRVVENFERAYVQDLLAKHCGNVTQAALEAGKDRRVFGRLMKRYAIQRKAS
jgi:DNA-binding NtrC family response regulator